MVDTQLHRDKYSVGETIARGGMGTVLSATDKNIRRQVAMKVLHAGSGADTETRLRFVNEAQITGQLEHPGIVPVYDLGTDMEGKAYYTMKLIQGDTLESIIEQLRAGDESYSLARLLGIFLRVCEPMAFAHSRGIVHRDLKPANVMVGEFGEVLVVDWGIAKAIGHPDDAELATPDTVRFDALEGDSVMTMDGQVMGTPAYMSPEQAYGRSGIDARSDVYCLGAILYSLLTLQPPYVAKGAAKVLLAVTKGQLEPPDQRAPERGIPSELVAVTMKAMAREPEGRYPSVAELARDIELFLEGRAVSAKVDSMGERALKLARRNRGVSIAIAAALVVLAGMSAVFVQRLAQERDEAVASEARAQAALAQVQAAEAERDSKAREAARATAAAAVKAASTGYLREAGARAAAATSLDPAGPWGPYAWGVIAMEQGDLESAAKRFEKALIQDPMHGPSQAAVSKVKAKQGKVDELQELAERIPDMGDWRALMDAGAALRGIRDFANARLAYKRAMRLIESAPGVTEKDKGAAANGYWDTNAWVASEGFYDSVKDEKPDAQRWALMRKFKEIHPLDAGKVEPEIRFDANGLYSINCSWTKIRYLQPMRGFPFRHAKINDARIGDIGPLRGMPLESLDMFRTGIADLEPLRGMPLRVLKISWCRQLTSLDPLSGMGLVDLEMQYTLLKDIAPLHGMPLKRLVMWEVPVTDLAPLTAMPLEELNIDKTPVSDISPLIGSPLQKLHMAQTACEDFSPLANIATLTFLNVSETSIADLTPISQLPNLNTFRATLCPQLRDVSPLSGSTFERLDLSECINLKDITPLRAATIKTLVLKKHRLSKDSLPVLDDLRQAGTDVVLK
jgi:tetratricopeptide (TPR) repeat protein